ncbi:MAG TPA: DUF5522 domain-containing protein [Hanamia sp.]|jgi:hypothetical protein|nr:DUF5522 domain-containing protein [Hanamia sp.]
MKGENFVEGIDFYFDKSGLMVFTEKYHLQRGYCCGNGCRHCPFNYENVADLKKKELLKKNNSPEKES